MRATNTLLMASLFAATTALPAIADYLVKEIGSFHVGGRSETLTGMPTRDVSFSVGMPAIKVDPNGEFEVEQMYVQYVKLAQPKGRVPILMWHGGGLSGVTWETKPDGKPGWQQWFLNAGYDVYVSDAVERGRASWARYPEIYKSEPMFRTKKEAWELFRIGPSYEPGGQRLAFEGQQFPVEAFDQFGKQGVPRWLLPTTRPLRRPMTRWCRKCARASSSCTARAAISDSMRRSTRPTRSRRWWRSSRRARPTRPRSISRHSRACPISSSGATSSTSTRPGSVSWWRPTAIARR
jgi:hypothetical protein